MTKDPLILTVDGKGVVMRPEALREQTRKALQQEQTKLKTRLSKGEKRNRKRMATVAVVYDIERNVRHPRDIIPDLKPVKRGRNEKVTENKDSKLKNPRARNKRVWASVERESGCHQGDVRRSSATWPQSKASLGDID